MKIKSGFVTIVGKPNVGKSTLMNRLLGEELSIVTNKPQTTRKRVLGILSEDNYQIIFLDTPGILNPKYLMQEKLLEYVQQSVKDADIIVLMVTVEDIKRDGDIFNDEQIDSIIKIKNRKKILLINKVDLSEQSILMNAIDRLEKKEVFDAVIPTSAIEGYNLENILNSIIELLPEHPKYYPDDQLSDEPERFFVSEKIREKIFELFHDEIPYSVEVVIEDFKERERGKDYISATIIVERASQKPIIIGRKGASIKKLGNIAREAIERFLMREVYLELRVKVAENWRKDENALNRFGYTKL